MLLSGIQPFTLLDYPNQTSCVIFTAGCNFRCGYCHNPEFVWPERIRALKDAFIPEATFFNFLQTRRGLLDGVVVSGGEPTIMPNLLIFLARVKELGFLVKLDTNGNRPEVLQEALLKQLVDYVALDIKTSLAEYPALVGPLVNPNHIKRSIGLIKDHAPDYEFRCTLIKEIHTPAVLEDMRQLIQGAKRLYLQTFRPGHTLKSEFEKYHSFNESETAVIAEIFRSQVAQVIIR